MQKIKGHIKDQCNIILRQFNEPDLFVSVGPGHIHSEVYYLHQFWRETTFWGFEPSQKRYNQLLEFGFPGSLFNTALSDYNGNLTGYEEKTGGCFVQNLAKDRKGRDFNKVDINCYKFGDFNLENFNSIFLWADVEGAELYVLKGAENLLQQKVIAGINLESTDRARAQRTGWPEIGEIKNYLRQFGYCRIKEKFKNQDILYTPTYD